MVRRRTVAVVATVMVFASGCTYLGRVNVPSGSAGSAPPSTVASTDPAISADGGVVAFVSEAADLVAGDTNGTADVFVREGTTTERVSVADGGGQSAGVASSPALSADGRFVAFVSSGDDLVAGDTNAVADVFVHDRDTGATTRVSVAGGGAQANGASAEPSISPSGEWVAYTSEATNLVGGDSNGVADVFLSARAGGDTSRASAPDAVTRPFQQANGASSQPRVSDTLTGYIGDGEPVVVFTSAATNLVNGDGNGAGDVFVTTRVFGALVRTLRLSDGTGASEPSIGLRQGGPGFVVAYTDGGEVLAVERDSPVDLSGVARRAISVDTDGLPADGPSGAAAVSADGRLVAFESSAGNLGEASGTSAGDIRIGRGAAPTIDDITPGRVGLLETRDLTITGRNFDPTSSAVSLGGVTVNSTTFVSPSELVVNVTATVDAAADDFHTFHVVTSGVPGTLVGLHTASCEDCVEIAAVVEQPGPVDIEITAIDLRVGDFDLDAPSCVLGACPAVTGDVSVDGELDFGIDSLEVDPIEIPVELFEGVETTVGVAPRFVAPSGTVIPANGAMDLGFGLALGLENPLLPSSCAIGPVQAVLSAGPGGSAEGVAYDQLTGTAVLHGAFTEELAVSGCGLFTGVLNALFGFPVPIAENELAFSVQLDPVLTGSVVP